ncbi:MAG: hypothetical protein RBT63_07340 [Bdellovibrionales bacterium]|nr:hypothetical protein [Bdellovibrionales bacterium]
MPTSDLFISKVTTAVLATLALTAVSTTTLAAGGHFSPKAKPAPTAPSDAYSGDSPIDASHGAFFSKGTFGQRNAQYEEWAQAKPWAVSLAEKPYSYEQKDRFIATLDERIQHYEHAVWNWARKTEITKPEVAEYASKATEEIKPRIERARAAWKKAKSAGRSDWEAAQEDAKRVFLELKSFYSSLHRNVR